MPQLTKDNIKAGLRVKVCKPSDQAMNRAFIGKIGTIVKRTFHHENVRAHEDLWIVEFEDGKQDAFYIEELIIPHRVKQKKGILS